jgi:P pilus assembly chaperone PapD
MTIRLGLHSILVSGLLLVCVVGCSNGAVVIESKVSPDAKRVAVITQEDWGATEPYMLFVTVYDSGFDRKTEELPLIGRAPIFAIEKRGPQEVQIAWASNRDLVVHCISCAHAEVERKLIEYKGTAVHYEFADSVPR